MSDIPVIVLNWEGWDDTLECLRSLRKAADVTTVWLVDNGSATDRSEEARAIYPGLRFVRLGRNYGFAGGMNRAMRMASAEGHSFVYLLNNDTAVVPGFLDAVEKAAAVNVALVGSRIVGHGSHSGLVLFDGEYYEPDDQPVYRSSGVRSVSHVNGAGMLVRLAALERNGYFDERLFCYHEELELCGRLAKAGWSFALADGSHVLHKRRRSDYNSNALYYRIRNRFLMLEHQHGWRGTKRRLQVLRHAAVTGRRALLERNGSDWRAAASGVYDGIHGRSGQREPHGNAKAASMLLLLACAIVPDIRRPRSSKRVRLAGPPRSHASPRGGTATGTFG